VANPEQFKEIAQHSFRDNVPQFSSVEASAANSFRDEVNSPRPSESSLSSTVAKGYTVLKDVAYGAASEIINHPGKLLEGAEIGACFGGLAIFNPKFSSFTAGALAGVGGAQAYESSSGSKLWQTIKTATGSDSPDSQSRLEAEQSLQKLGAKSIDLAAMMLGGLISYKVLGRWVKTAGVPAMNEVSGLSKSAELSKPFE
jgi:hypothetical protein